MQNFLIISPTEEEGKKYEAGQRFIDGGYIALGWYHQDFTGWEIDKILEHIKLQGFKDQEEAIKAHKDFSELKIGDIVAITVVNKCILAIGKVTSEYKFKKYMHDTGSDMKEKFYSHFREIEWISTDRLDRKTIKLDIGEKYWKPRGTTHLYQNIPNYIQTIINLNTEIDIVDTELIGYEGRIKEYLYSHKIVERDRTFVKKYKEKFSHIKVCPGCSLNPEEKYTIRSADFFELHHITTLSSRKSEENIITSESDVMMLCPNCHRFIHKLMTKYGTKKVTLKELKEHIN